MATTSNDRIDKDAVQSVSDLLCRSVPRDDVPAIPEEFKKDFVFSKKRARRRKPQRRRARVAAGLSGAERRALGLGGAAGAAGVTYATARGMHALWVAYMTRLLELDGPPPQPGSPRWDSFSQSVHRAELTGALASVVRARCASLVGLRGVVVRDSRWALSLVTERDRVVTVPKRQVLLRLEAGAVRLLLFGKHLCARPADRAVRKLKCQSLPEL